MKILYFAWLREKLGRAEEDLDPPDGVATVGDLLDWLAARNPDLQAILDAGRVIRMAVNQDFADPATPVSRGDEIALFPPVTGG